MSRDPRFYSRKSRENALQGGMDHREAEIELDAVLETLVDGVIIIDEGGLMRLFNPACIKIFEYQPEEVLGQNVKMLMPEPFHSEHDGYLQAYTDTGRKKIIGIGREVEGRRKNGTIFPMDLAVGETRLEGKPIFVGVIRDLSERHEQAKKYEKLQQEHFHLSRVSAMNEMGSAIAHELNQPMAASINYMETAKLLLSRDSLPDKDKVFNIISNAIEQTHRASEIIARMRGFIERGEVEKKPHSLKEVVESAARLVFISFDDKGIDLSVDISEDLPKVLINDVQIQQVLVNLIKNACEAMLDSSEKRLSISACVASCGKFIDLQIADTGHGLSEEDVETLFVPFSSNKKGGMGVGLSISQSIIRHHNGQIWAINNDPQGTIFQFTLPLYEPR